MRIDAADVLVVNPTGPRYSWASDLPEQQMTNTILRIRSSDGCYGVSGITTYSNVGTDLYVAETLRHLLPGLIGMDPRDRERIWSYTNADVLPVRPSAQSSIDIALWDWWGRQTQLPVFKLIGGARDRIQAYASTPLLENPRAYVEFVTELRAQGFRAIKFHAWCEPNRDLEMLHAVHREHGGSGVRFMFDAENRYDRTSALRVAGELEQLGFFWFEAPLPDLDIDGYRELRTRVNIPLTPAGNWIWDLQMLNNALVTGAWDSAHTDVCLCGGITAGSRIMTLAQASTRPCELQCWGFALSQAANLHLMLGRSNCTFFEQPVPYEAYEYGMKTAIRTDRDGYVHAPEGVGLGLEVDWDALDAAAVQRASYP